MKAECFKALDVVRSLGASYGDARIVKIHSEALSVSNGELAQCDKTESLGIGVRVVVNGAWGFASTYDLSPAGIESAAIRAVTIASESAPIFAKAVSLSPVQAFDDVWHTPFVVDPFKVSLEDRLDLLQRANQEMRFDDRIKRADSSMDLLRESQWFASTEGSWIRQQLTRCGAGLCAIAVDNDESQLRSYPMSFGGNYLSGGYELIQAYDLVANARQTAAEAIALTTAAVCPEQTADLILMPNQLCLQIHESVGHPNELDRVFGWEADFAGRSFVKPEMWGKFRYGSENVNLIADNTLPGGLATLGYDDDGVPAQRWPIVQNGLFVGTLTTRDTAPLIKSESNGCNRAQGWSHVPITRIPNLSLMPGNCSLDEIIAATDSGVLMETCKSWSIDQRRLNFQFGCELAWEVKNGKKTRLLKNPNYQDMTPRFWRSCDMIANHDHWQLMGVANCGKGQPGQIAEMSHGCSPARFRDVKIGVRSN